MQFHILTFKQNRYQRADMVNFEISLEFAKIIKNSGLNKKRKKELLSGSVILSVDLISFYRTSKPTTTLLDLIKSTRYHFPRQINPNEAKRKIKSKSYYDLMESLRKRAKEEEFQKLIKPKTQFDSLYEASDEDISPVKAHKELKSEITTIVNVIVSVLSVVWACWHWTDSSMNIQDSYRVLLCLFFGLLVLVAEVVVYMGYVNRIEEAKVNERKKKETKRVVKTIDGFGVNGTSTEINGE